MKLIFGLLFAITLLFAGPPSTAYAEEIDIEAAAIQAVVPDVVAKFGVSEDFAKHYLSYVTSAIRARETADKDGSDVSQLYAEALEKYAEAILFSEVVLIRGKALLDEIKDGVPGATVPQPLVKKINAWAFSASDAFIMSADAAETASEWATQHVLKSGFCDVHGPRLDFEKCEKITKEAIDLFDKINNQFESMTDSIRVLELTVPRMTY